MGDVSNFRYGTVGGNNKKNKYLGIYAADAWKITPRVTLSYGLRWEAQKEPDPITPASQVFFAPFIGKPGFPSTGNIPSSWKQFQPFGGVDVEGE